jgi:hypothetical protein
MMMKPPMIKKPTIQKRVVNEDEDEIKPFVIPKRGVSVPEEEIKPFSIPKRVSIDKSDEEI